MTTQTHQAVVPDTHRDLLDDPDREFVDGLSERYMGKRPYPYHQPGDERVIVYIRPQDTWSMAA